MLGDELEVLAFVVEELVGEDDEEGIDALGAPGGGLPEGGLELL